MIYASDSLDNISLIQDAEDNKYYIRTKDKDGEWNYPLWDYIPFNTVDDAEAWINTRYDETSLIGDNYGNINGINEIKDAMRLLGLCRDESNPGTYTSTFNTSKGNYQLSIEITWEPDGTAHTHAYLNNQEIPSYKLPRDTKNISRLIQSTECLLNRYGVILASEYTNSYIKSAKNTNKLAQDMVRVKSSNIWAYTIDVKDRKDKFGDVLVQFKGENGGPGDIYIYYDVPILTYRRWHSAPSKGHYFWVYIRNNFRYSKLTGDKKGKLHNAVN